MWARVAMRGKNFEHGSIRNLPATLHKMFNMVIPVVKKSQEGYKIKRI